MINFTIYWADHGDPKSLGIKEPDGDLASCFVMIGYPLLIVIVHQKKAVNTKWNQAAVS